MRKDEFEGENAGRFTWRTDGGEEGFTDPDGIRDMKPAQVLEWLFVRRTLP